MGRQLGAEHSQRLESYFQSIPGVQLVACSTVANAKALLKSAIRSDNPIIFFEHVLLYNVKGGSPHHPALLTLPISSLAVHGYPKSLMGIAVIWRACTRSAGRTCSEDHTLAADSCCRTSTVTCQCIPVSSHSILN